MGGSIVSRSRAHLSIERVTAIRDVARTGPNADVAQSNAPSNSRTDPKVIEIIGHYFGGRYEPYPDVYQYAIGADITLRKLALGIRFPSLSIEVDRSISHVAMILGGLYVRERLDEGEIGRVARAVGTDMRNLRRIGADAQENPSGVIMVVPDPGLKIMLDTVNADAAVNPARYEDSRIVGGAIRQRRELSGRVRKQMAKRSKTPIMFISMLEHGTIPAELMGHAFVDNVLDALGIDRAQARAIGALVLAHPHSTRSARGSHAARMGLHQGTERHHVHAKAFKR